MSQVPLLPEFSIFGWHILKMGPKQSPWNLPKSPALLAHPGASAFQPIVGHRGVMTARTEGRSHWFPPGKTNSLFFVTRMK